MFFYDDINKSIVSLKEKLDKLSVREPIKSTSKIKNEFGYFIENYLGIKQNDLPIADYLGIEIKCINTISKYPIKLFTCEFDGDEIFLSKKLFDEYAKNVTENYKTFNHIFSSDRYTYLIDNVFGKLNVDYKKEQVILEIISRNKVISSQYFWTFKSIYNRIINKINYIAIIEYENKYINGEKYFNFNKYTIYKIRDFNEFINMLAVGKIGITCSMDSKTKDNVSGRIHNHGCAFYIRKEYINYLFKKIE